MAAHIKLQPASIARSAPSIAPPCSPSPIRLRQELLSNGVARDRDLADTREPMLKSSSQDEGTRDGRSKRGAPQQKHAQP